MTQAETFLNGEGNAWLERNTRKIPIEDDLVLKALNQIVGIPCAEDTVLEIGCSNGWRLSELKKLYGCTVVGIDPSEVAVEEAKKAGINAYRGCAHALQCFKNGGFTIVIYGFCLYLADRDLLFEIAKEGDRVLADGGLMVLYDFSTPHPCKVPYKHKDGIWTYKQDYERMFLWNPAYRQILTVHHRDGQTKATILKKNLSLGWSDCESASSASGP